MVMRWTTGSFKILTQMISKRHLFQHCKQPLSGAVCTLKAQLQQFIARRHTISKSRSPIIKRMLGSNDNTAGSCAATNASETTKSSRGDRVLCLDGGGIRGLIEIQMLKEIEKALGNGMKIRDCFDWIGGTSTGGILALAILHGKSLDECHDMYWNLKDKVFSGSKPYDSTPLEDLLKKEFGETTKMTDKSCPRVIVTSVLADRLPVKLHLFRNYDSPEKDDPDDTDFGLFPPCTKPQDQLVWETARSTGAAPTFFAPYKNFIDGGMMANNPTLDMITEINEYNMAHGRTFKHRPIDVVVSLGTGKSAIRPGDVPHFYNPESLIHMLTHPIEDYENVKGVIRMAEVLLKQAMRTERQAIRRAKNWCRMIGTPYFRFSPTLLEQVHLDCTDDKTLNDIISKTMEYLEEPEQQKEFQNMVEILQKHS